MSHGIIDSLRKSVYEWKAIPENLRSGEKRKRIPAIFGIVGSAVLACAGIKLGVGIAADIDESIKTQAAAVQEGLNRPSCTGEVVNRQQNSPHEVIFPAGQTHTTIEVPESQTVTMTLGEGCHPGTPGREVKIDVRDDLWEKVKPGDILYHPGGSTDWDIYDDSGIPMGDLPASKNNESIEPAASEFYISPQALEEIASN